MTTGRDPNGRRARWLLPAMFALALPVFAQQTTERFIPIGESPGISGRLSTIGTVGEFEDAAGMLRVDGADGSKTYRVTPRTRIWIDRSAAGESSLVGEPGDLAAGRRVEVMHRRDDPQTADWIKLAAE